MMEIWIKSIARAGGVEMPASARVIEPRSQRQSPELRATLARWLRSAGTYLLRAGDRVYGEPSGAKAVISRY
jgi:hypothetical protein